MPRTKLAPKIQEIPFITFAAQQRLASKEMYGRFYPAVTKDVSQEGTVTYNICIKTGESWRGQYVTVSWDYFKLDATGLIYQSPHGSAKQYNKKIRLLDMDKAVEMYKDKVC
jgi:hypothetical protein